MQTGVESINTFFCQSEKRKKGKEKKGWVYTSSEEWARRLVEDGQALVLDQKIKITSQKF